MGRLNASDLHLKVGSPPTFRVSGVLKPVQGPPLSADEADHLLEPIVPDSLRARYEREGGVDFATHSRAGERFRINMYRCGGHTHAAIRRIKTEIPTFESLRLPPIYREMAERTNEGMVIVSGVTGCGKSTTLAAMLEHINAREAVNIITIEDPVEYQFSKKAAAVSQREIGIDVPDYPTALRYIVRQDPDVVFIGEMRDHDTVLAAIQAAETGHLVFGSLHTADASQTLSRNLEFFPPAEHAFIRGALSSSLRAVMSQRLLPALPETGFGMVPATEVLLNTPTVRELIRDSRDGACPRRPAHGDRRGGARGDAVVHAIAGGTGRPRVGGHGHGAGFAPNREALESAIKGVEVKASTMIHRVRNAPKP